MQDSTVTVLKYTYLSQTEQIGPSSKGISIWSSIGIESFESSLAGGESLSFVSTVDGESSLGFFPTGSKELLELNSSIASAKSTKGKDIQMFKENSNSCSSKKTKVRLKSHLLNNR